MLTCVEATLPRSRWSKAPTVTFHSLTSVTRRIIGRTKTPSQAMFRHAISMQISGPPNLGIHQLLVFVDTDSDTDADADANGDVDADADAHAHER